MENCIPLPFPWVKTCHRTNKNAIAFFLEKFSETMYLTNYPFIGVGK